jgi:hypothetical protein
VSSTRSLKVRAATQGKQTKIGEFFAKQSVNVVAFAKDEVVYDMALSPGMSCSEACSDDVTSEDTRSRRSIASTATDCEIEQQIEDYMVSLSELMSDCSKDICLCECHVSQGYGADFSAVEVVDACTECLCFEQW